MRRDIVTTVDAQAFIKEATVEGAAQPPPPPTPDQWYEQLLKYIPGEAISLYLAIEGVIKSAQMAGNELRFWLAFGLVICMIFGWAYLHKVWHVSRRSQIAISAVALVAYVFALGGVFATFSFYHAWQGSIVLVVTTAFLALYPPPGPARKEP